MGLVPSCDSSGDALKMDSVVRELGDLISNQMPDNKNSPLAALLPGFTSLRLLLVKTNRSEREAAMLDKANSLYGQCKRAGHSKETIAAMICRDFMQGTRQGNINSTAENPHSDSFGYGSSNEKSIVSGQDSYVTSCRRGSLHTDESQQSSVTQLPQNQHQLSSKFLGVQSNVSQNPNAEALHQHATHNYSDMRNRTLVASNNELTYSVSPSLHALIHSPFLHTLEGHSEMLPLNIANHAEAHDHEG